MANRNTHYYTTLCAWPQLNAHQSLSNLLSKSSLATFSASGRCLNSSSFPVSDDKSSISLTEAEAWSSKGFTFSCCWKALGLVWSSQVGCFAFFGRMNLNCWARLIMVNLPCGCFRRCIHTKLRRRFPAGWSSRQIRLLTDRYMRHKLWALVHSSNWLPSSFLKNFNSILLPQNRLCKTMCLKLFTDIYLSNVYKKKGMGCNLNIIFCPATARPLFANGDGYHFLASINTVKIILKRSACSEA